MLGFVGGMGVALGMQLSSSCLYGNASLTEHREASTFFQIQQTLAGAVRLDCVWSKHRVLAFLAVTWSLLHFLPGHAPVSPSLPLLSCLCPDLSFLAKVFAPLCVSFLSL